MIFCTLIVVWLLSILAAVYCLSREEWHYKATCYLRWALFPISIILFPKKLGIKSWLSYLFSPFMMLAYFVALALWLFSIMFSDSYGVPNSIPYHTGDELRRITGIAFPDIIPVDSAFHETIGFSETIIKFVPDDALSPSFYQDLEKACMEDSINWSKDSLGYHFSIYPDITTDSTKEDNTSEDSPQNYIRISIPLSGDTIYVHDGILSNF